MIRYLKNSLSALFLIAISGQATAQMVGNDAFEFKNLTFHTKPPKYLLSRKSAVVLSVSPSPDNQQLRGDWEALAEELHASFKKMGIDAVAYYYADDLFAGSDINNSFIKQLTDRDFKYVIYVDHTHSPTNANLDPNYKIIVAPFSKDSDLIAESANAWKVEGPSLKALLNKMSKEIHRKEMGFSNYLIPDDPEYFTDAPIIKGRRIPTYAMDLKVEPLIIPKFQKLIIKDSTKMDEALRNKIEVYNEGIDQKNAKLTRIMETYPLKYEITDDFSDKEVYNNGGQYVLLHFSSTGERVMDFLDYKPTHDDVLESKTDMGKKRLPKRAEITKFYVKHVFAKDVYTGLNWDADLTWEEALENFIFNMKDILKVN